MKEYYLLRRDQVLDAFGVTSQGHTTDHAQRILEEKGPIYSVKARRKAPGRCSFHSLLICWW